MQRGGRDNLNRKESAHGSRKNRMFYMKVETCNFKIKKSEWLAVLAFVIEK